MQKWLYEKCKWQPRNGYDGKSVTKINNDKSGKFALPHPSFTKNCHKIHLNCCFIKIFVTDLPLQHFLTATCISNLFSYQTFCIGPHFFLQSINIHCTGSSFIVLYSNTLIKQTPFYQNIKCSRILLVYRSMDFITSYYQT